MDDRVQTGKPPPYVTSYQANSASYPQRDSKGVDPPAKVQ